jgi:hypothetical protein
MKHHIKLITTTTLVWIDQNIKTSKYDQINHNNKINIHLSNSTKPNPPKSN